MPAQGSRRANVDSQWCGALVAPHTLSGAGELAAAAALASEKKSARVYSDDEAHPQDEALRQVACCGDR